MACARRSSLRLINLVLAAWYSSLMSSCQRSGRLELVEAPVDLLRLVGCEIALARALIFSVKLGSCVESELAYPKMGVSR